MKTFNKLISFAVISMTSLTYTACSDGFLTVTLLIPCNGNLSEKMMQNCKTYFSMVIITYKTLTQMWNYVNSFHTDEGYDYKKITLDHISSNESMGCNLRIIVKYGNIVSIWINRCNNVLQKLDNASKRTKHNMKVKLSFVAYAYFTLKRLLAWYKLLFLSLVLACYWRNSSLADWLWLFSSRLLSSCRLRSHCSVHNHKGLSNHLLDL